MQSRQVGTARVLDLHFDAVFLRAQCALGLQHLTHCTWKSQVLEYMRTTCENWLELRVG
jgi:hypothetical protein